MDYLTAMKALSIILRAIPLALMYLYHQNGLDDPYIISQPRWWRTGGTNIGNESRRQGIGRRTQSYGRGNTRDT